MTSDFRASCLSTVPGHSSEGRCLIIGEVAQSHDGSLGMAHAFIDAITAAGADAVKFQTHIAKEESTPQEPWRVKFSPQDETRYQYWQRMEFTTEQWAGLKQHADDAGILFMSTPFSEPAVKMLKDIEMKVWKIASGEVDNAPLLQLAINTGDPVIISSGMSDWDELDSAVEQVRAGGNPLAVMQCTSAYPCPPERVGLNVLGEMRQRYDVPVGLSDHSGNIYAGLAAVTLGAEVLEVHVALSKEMFGPDVPSSVTTAELRQLVDGTREIEKMMSSPLHKETLSDEAKELRKLFTKSIVAGMFLSKGTILDQSHLKLKKPGTGLSASYLPELIGRKLLKDVQEDDFISIEDMEARSSDQHA